MTQKIKPTVRMTTSARVTVQFDIEIGSTWGPGCTLAQVATQASEEAIGHVRNRFNLPRMKVKVINIDAISTNAEFRHVDD